MPKTTFHQHVRTGKIKKVVPAGQTEGYYPKADIDRMAKAREMLILEYAVEPSTFMRATEEDMRGIYELCVSLFGITGTPPYETMLSWRQKNPDTYYVLKREGFVTGYIGFLYLNKETTQHIMREQLPGLPTPPAAEVLSITPGTPIDGLFVGLAVRPGLSATQSRWHGGHLITGGMQVLEDFAKRGMPVKKLFATSRTLDGIELCRKFGFKEITYPGDPIYRFELDLEKFESPALEEYRKLAKARLQARKAARLNAGTPVEATTVVSPETSSERIQGMADFFEKSPDEPEVEMSDLTFRQATPDDTDGIYAVAASLFGSTTSAEARKPLIDLCPQGNYIVEWNKKIVAYIHIQPLKHERMMAFMRGEIRGKDITANDLDCFTPGKAVECLVKSVGALKTIGITEEVRRLNQLHFLFKLLRGTALEMAKLGSQGVPITKIFATSETVTGIEMAYSAKMGMFGKPFAGGRFRYVMDVETSDLPLLQPYKRALAAWQQAHDSPPKLTTKGTSINTTRRKRTNKQPPPINSHSSP